ncbi:MAG: MBL fold metallo-hydrolase [Ignavibacteriaceae bacterium]|jgi:cyclase
MKFIKSLFLVTVIISNIWAQSFESDHFRIKKLDEGIYAAISKTGGYAICNSGIVDLGDETLVFDTFISPIAARDLKQAAEVLTGNKVKYVINSHFQQIT